MEPLFGDMHFLWSNSKTRWRFFLFVIFTEHAHGVILERSLVCSARFKQVAKSIWEEDEHVGHPFLKDYCFQVQQVSPTWLVLSFSCRIPFRRHSFAKMSVSWKSSLLTATAAKLSLSIGSFLCFRMIFFFMAAGDGNWVSSRLT